MSAFTEILSTIEKAFADDDVDQFASCFAEDGVQHHPFFPAPLQGREAIRAAEGAMFAAFDDITFAWERTLEQGNQGAGQFVVTARNTRDIAMPDGSTIPATGKTVSLRGGMFMTIGDDGLITEAYRHQDNMGFLQQLGLLG